jgi:hypothetical protein
VDELALAVFEKLPIICLPKRSVSTKLKGNTEKVRFKGPVSGRRLDEPGNLESSVVITNYGTDETDYGGRGSVVQLIPCM